MSKYTWKYRNYTTRRTLHHTNSKNSQSMWYKRHQPQTITWISHIYFTTTMHHRSLKLGVFPDTWKLANIAPIYKSKETNLIKNYMPISLLSCLSKLFERCVLKYFQNYLINNNIISFDQSAFTAGDGTVNQLVNIHDDVCRALDEGNDIQMIFLTLVKHSTESGMMVSYVNLIVFISKGISLTDSKVISLIENNA